MQRVQIFMRRPSAGRAELVISTDGKCEVYKLGFNTLRNLAAEAVKAYLVWPVKDCMENEDETQ